jgi:hypothetical protein
MWGSSPFAQVDYLSDPRIKELSFGRLKKFLKDHGATNEDLFLASTKFALVATAEKMGVQLEPVLVEANIAATAAPPSQRSGRNTGKNTPKKKPMALAVVRSPAARQRSTEAASTRDKDGPATPLSYADPASAAGAFGGLLSKIENLSYGIGARVGAMLSGPDQPIVQEPEVQPQVRQLGAELEAARKEGPQHSMPPDVENASGLAEASLLADTPPAIEAPPVSQGMKVAPASIEARNSTETQVAQDYSSIPRSVADSRVRATINWELQDDGASACVTITMVAETVSSAELKPTETEISAAVQAQAPVQAMDITLQSEDVDALRQEVELLREQLLVWNAFVLGAPARGAAAASLTPHFPPTEGSGAETLKHEARLLHELCATWSSFAAKKRLMTLA